MHPLRFIKKHWKAAVIGLTAFIVIWVLGNPAPGSGMPIKTVTTATKQTPVANAPWNSQITSISMMQPTGQYAPLFRGAGLDQQKIKKLAVTDIIAITDGKTVRSMTVQLNCNIVNTNADMARRTIGHYPNVTNATLISGRGAITYQLRVEFKNQRVQTSMQFAGKTLDVIDRSGTCATGGKG